MSSVDVYVRNVNSVDEYVQIVSSVDVYVRIVNNVDLYVRILTTEQFRIPELFIIVTKCANNTKRRLYSKPLMRL